MYATTTLLQKRDILRLHKMHADGVSIRDIASALRIHPNNVTQHLKFRIAYTKDIVDQLKHRAPRINTDFPIPLLDAAPLLPGWPSQGKLYSLVRKGILSGKKTRIGSSTCLVVTRSQIQAAAKKMMPREGLFIRSNSLRRLTEGEIQPGYQKFHLRYWPCHRYHWIQATEIADQLIVPVAQVHQANLCLDITGRAAIA